MPPRQRQILKLIFLLSFDALSRNLVESDYEVWSERKSRIHRRLNLAVFKFVSAATFNKPRLADTQSKQVLLDILHEVVMDHLKRRVSLYKLCGRLGLQRRGPFVFVSLIAAYFDAFKKATLATLKNLKSRVFDVNAGSGVVVLAIGFPEHSFSMSEGEGKLSEIPSSFADFFLARYPGATLISVDEYIRPSKRRENTAGLREGAEPKSLPRHQSKRRVGARAIASTMRRVVFEIGALIFRLMRFNGVALFELMFYAYWARSFDYVRIAERLGQRLEAIFFLPLSSGLGILPHLRATHDKLVCYSYSQNYCEPPTALLNQGRYFGPDCDCRTALADISPDGWRISGKAEGFTDIFAYMSSLKRFMSTRFSLELPMDGFSQPHQQPVLLGYETAGASIPEGDNRYIVIFDVPPEGRHEQLSRHFCGNLSYDFSVVSEFLRELAQTCVECGFDVFLKPKYSLGNYAAEYGRLLRELLADYKSRFHLLSPYTNARSVIESAAASISMPFTSMKLVCDHVSLPSFYYMPERFRVSFTRSGSRTDIHFGKAQLAATLTQLTR